MHKIIVAVCGSISAYVACELVDALHKGGEDVHVIMTPTAARFVTPLSFQVLSDHPVAIDNYALGEPWHIPHIQLSRDADALFIVPATATTMAKIAAGMADNVLTAAVLSARCPIYFAPSMNVNMYENPVTQSNIQKLCERGMHLIEPATGKMICGATGRGKMLSAETLKAIVWDIIARL